MKRFGALILIVCIITVSIPALPLFAATPTVSITASRDVLVPGQEVTISFTVSPQGTPYRFEYEDDYIPATTEHQLEAVLMTYSAIEEVNSNSTNNNNNAFVELENPYVARHKGTAVLTIIATDPSTGREVSASVTIKVRTPTGLISGEDYYIMNSTTEKFLSLSSSTDANSVAIIGRARSSAAISQWTVNITEPINNQVNYTRLASVYCNSQRNAYVTSSGLITYNTTSARTNFALHRIESGTHEGQYVLRHGDQYVAMNSSGNVYITASSSENIYWTFMAVEKGSARLYSTSYPYTLPNGDTYTFDTTVNNGRFQSQFTTLGYQASYSINSTASSAYLNLKRNSIFAIYSHGGSGAICFYDANGNSHGDIVAYPRIQYSIFNLDDNALSSLRCVLYIGCSTATDYQTGDETYNLLDESFKKGAHFALGLSEDTYVPQADLWLQRFLESTTKSDVNTIEEMLDYADSNFGSLSFTDIYNNSITVNGLPYIYRGDTQQLFRY